MKTLEAASKRHWSDCSLWNGPAERPEPCDCGGFGRRRWWHWISNVFLLLDLRRRYRKGLL